MNPVGQSVSRSAVPSTLSSASPERSQQPSATQRPSVAGGRDEFVASAASAPAKAPSGGKNLTATVDKIDKKGALNQMTTGKITVNGRTYDYRSGGHGNGNLPPGEYKVTPHLWSRNTPGMVVGGVGYSFALSDKHDPRTGKDRSLLRIHPDGGTPGTQGCIGIVGNAAVQKQFLEDMRAELARNGGSFTLKVG